MSDLAKFWLPPPASEPDTHGAFRGRFRLERAAGVTLRFCGASWFALWLLTYAAQWVRACVDYLRLSGDRALLARLRPAAERNLAALATHAGRRGLEAAGGWVFIDWGCPPAAAGEFDAPLNLRYLEALRAMGAWCALLGAGDAGAAYDDQAARTAALLNGYRTPWKPAAGKRSATTRRRSGCPTGCSRARGGAKGSTSSSATS